MTSLDTQLETVCWGMRTSQSQYNPDSQALLSMGSALWRKKLAGVASIVCGMTLSGKVSADQHKPWMADLRTQSSIWWEAKPAVMIFPPRVMLREEETLGQAGTFAGFTTALHVHAKTVLSLHGQGHQTWKYSNLIYAWFFIYNKRLACVFPKARWFG